ncbi:MAG: prephenate dehydrogenase/arogenate dehydrogenase family protein [Planctomycetes bacterium]|nr:prephenate dehydrogenase/arogenate dehydrogenase family protein [Planctomycetota bacterium]
MQWHKITIVGVGLIGGSIGLGVKKRGLFARVFGVGRDVARLEQAQRLGAIDETSLDLPSAVRESDLVVFCAPVDRIAEQVLRAAAHCKPGAVLTDAGSTKQAIVRAVESALPAGVGFVGSHPLAGSEKKGVEHAHADLFVDRVTVLTPTGDTPEETVHGATALWKGLGGRVTTMSPEHHDQALALTSHLPHLVASVLAGLLPDDWCELAASGFRDTTRIASGDPGVWTPIFQHNRQAVLTALDLFDERIREFRHALTQDDQSRLDELLTQGKKVRDALGS